MRKIFMFLIVLSILSTMALAATRIELYIDYGLATVDGAETPIDPDNSGVTPIIRNDRTLLPVRFIAENLDMAVEWDEPTQTVTLTGSKVITLTIGNTTAYVMGTAQTLDSPPVIHEDRTYLPVRFISEVLERKVDWDEEYQMVTIRPNPPVFETVEVFDGLTFTPIFPDGLSNTTFSTLGYTDGNMSTDYGAVYGSVNDKDANVLGVPMADFLANSPPDVFPVMFEGAVVKNSKILGLERFAFVNAYLSDLNADGPTDNIMYLVYDKDTDLFVFAAVIGTDQAAMDKLNEIVRALR